MMIQNIRCKIFCLVALLYWSYGPTFAQSSAFIYRDSVLLHVNGFAGKKAQFDSLQKAYSEELSRLNEQLDTKVLALTGVYAPKEGETISQLKQRMKPEDAQKLVLLEEENKLLEMRSSTYQQALEQNYNSELKPILDTIDLVISKYAQKHKQDMVFILEELGKSLAYVNKSKNITQTIILLVNKELTR